VSRSAEDRLASALDRVQSGGPAAVTGDDLEILELLGTGGYLRENLTRVPAPDAFRRELGDWLAQPRPEPWWRDLMGPLRRRVPESARRPVLGAAIGLGAVAAIALGVVALRRRQAAGASAS
jgi:hypothetical protein